MDNDVINELVTEVTNELAFPVFPYGTYLRVNRVNRDPLWIDVHSHMLRRIGTEAVVLLTDAPAVVEDTSFKCPVCDQPTTAPMVPCYACDDDFFEDDGDEIWFEPVVRYTRNKQALNWAEIQGFLRELKSGVANRDRCEIVLDPRGLRGSSFDIPWSVRSDLFDIERMTSADYVPDYPEPIQVEGSDELRKRVGGVWCHKHSDADYWHPMARAHKWNRQ